MRGRLAVVGIGPGSLGQLTWDAREELGGAQILIGYRAYLDQIPVEVSGAKRQAYDLGQERDRARAAVELAVSGERVALISSGDAGVYGMASIALDEVCRIPFQDRPEVAVIPGVTAALAAAALVGAPLAVDFACLSLSDLMLPWVELERRIHALAVTDLVLVLYNPRSGSRHEPWKATVAALTAARPADTPVAVVSRAHRPRQSIVLGELSGLSEIAVDMETVVIVGSSRTRRDGDWLLTLRTEVRE